MTLTQRRKGLGGAEEETSIDTAATGSVSSSIVVIQRPQDVTISTAEIESDEEEIFRRIANP